MNPGSELSTPRHIVLVGGGHAHVGVLHDFGRSPPPGVRLTLISPGVQTPYSGMLPGYVAGHYDYGQGHIDLSRLTAFAGARFVQDAAIGIDRAARRVICRAGPPQPYDLLSIDIGSTPRVDLAPDDAAQVLPVKPIGDFNARWLAMRQRVVAAALDRRPSAVAVVGGGAGGVEMTLAMQWRLRREVGAAGCDPGLLSFHLLTRGAEILSTHAPAARRKVKKILAARGVCVHLQSEVTEVKQVGGGRLRLGLTAPVLADEVLWVTEAGGAPWLRQTGLALDASGFICVNDCLQSISDPLIFAAGDVASMVGHALEKAGVVAVRQGPPLARNLRRAAAGQPLRPYRPQRRWLALISTGDRHAVASRGSFAVAGRWVWRWKDWVDRRFMARYAALPAPAVVTAPGGGSLSVASGASAVAMESVGSVASLASVQSVATGTGEVSVSIIVPVLDEAAGIGSALRALAPFRQAGAELVVVDGGSADATVEAARPYCDRLLVAPRGRGSQMNAGARAAHGDVLLFLHADTTLPAAALDDVRRAVAGGACWGRFDVRIAGSRGGMETAEAAEPTGSGGGVGSEGTAGGSFWFPLISALMNLRSRLTGIATGDQAIFATREVFLHEGGFPDLALMEDIAFSARLRKRQWPACLRRKVTTSGRRWERHGVLRTILRMFWLRARYFFGADPKRLAADYGYRPRGD